MFQSNAAKEILYIFLWLVGIIFVYALVHTFLLEPSSDTNSSSHTPHALVAKPAHIEAITKPKNTHEKTHISKTVVIPKADTPVAVSKIPEVPKGIHTPSKKKVKSSIKDTTTTHDNSLVSNSAHALSDGKTSKNEIATQDVNQVVNIQNKIKVTETLTLPNAVVPEAVTKAVEISKASSRPVQPVETMDNKPTKDMPKVQGVEKVSIGIQKPNLVSIPSVPSIPTVPSVPMTVKMKLLDTAKQHVNAANREVLNTLNK